MSGRMTFALEQLPPAMREQAEKKLRAGGSVRSHKVDGKLPNQAKKAKYRAKAMKAAGVTFGSQKEYRDYVALMARETASEIRNLRCQVKYSLFVTGGIWKGEHIGTYRADFVFEEMVKNPLWGKDVTQWRLVVADSKSAYTRKLRDWPRTRKLMRACHNIEVREL